MEESARWAEAVDVDEICALLEIARVEVEDYKGGRRFLAREARQPPLRASIAASIVDQEQRIVLGLIDGVIVGLASVRREQLPDGDHIAEMFEIYVMEQARGVSIGELMLTMVKEWAIDTGCSALESQVHPGNRHAKNFFETAGMVTRLLRVSTKLPDQAAPLS